MDRSSNLKGWHRLFLNPALKQSDEFGDVELKEILLDDKPTREFGKKSDVSRREVVFAHHESIGTHIEALDPVAIMSTNIMLAQDNEVTIKKQRISHRMQTVMTT